MYTAKERMNNLELIDIGTEMAYMAQHIQDHWTCPKDKPLNLLALVHSIYNQINCSASDYFDEYGFLDIYDEWIEWRENSPKWGDLESDKKKLITSYDAIYNVGEALLMQTKKEYDKIIKGFDFSRESKKILKKLKKDFPTLKNLTPKNERELLGQYEDNELILSDNLNFKGLNSQAATHQGFHIQVLPAEVIYRKCRHSSNYEDSLVSAIMGHSMAIIKINNTIDMLAELHSLKKIYDKPEFFQDLVYEIDMSVVKHPMLKKIFEEQISRTKKIYSSREQWEEQIHSSIKASKKFEALSKEEQEAVIKKNQEYIAKIFSSM